MEPPPVNSESGLQLSTGHLSTNAAAAWRVIGILLSHGRPVRPSELPKIRDSAPEIVRFLCSVPDSPIRFVDTNLIRLSPITVATVAQLCARSDVITRYLCLPRVVPRLLSNVRSNDIVRICCRKRKESRLMIEDFPLAKRKTLLIDFDEEESLNQLAVVIPGGFQNGIETLPSSSSTLEYDIQKQEKIILGPAMLKEPSFDHLSPPPHIMGNTEGSKICDIDISKQIILSMLEIDEQMTVPHEENEDVIQGCTTLIKYDNGKMKEVCPHESCSYTGHKKNQPMTITFTDKTEVDMPEKTLGDGNIEVLSPTSDRNECHLMSRDEKLNVMNSSLPEPAHKDKISDIEIDVGHINNHKRKSSKEKRKRASSKSNGIETLPSSSSTLENDIQKQEKIILGPAMLKKPSFDHLSLPAHIMGNPEGSKICDIDISKPIISSMLEMDEHMIVPHEENEDVIQGCATLIEYDNGKMKEVCPHESCSHMGHKKNQPITITFTDKTEVDRPEKTLGDANVLSPDRDINECYSESQDEKLNVMKNSSLPKPAHKDKTSDIKIDIGHINNHKRKSMEKRKRASSKSNNHIEKKSFPDFKSFTVEEEEGSGGYGTVYRAKRKADGLTFAIKCPHVNANRNYVINEMKMLERLRGKHFVIKSAGSFKSGSADCLVLEHIEHDRPEILKKEIDITHLQWYGYCLFKALAGLHNQGIVHRDVKPGNFLYSRKANKGFLIDFNLALDMHKKRGISDNSKTGHSLNDPVNDPCASSLPPAKSRKLKNIILPEAIKGDSGKVSKSILPPGNMKKKVDKARALTDASGRSSIKSQGGDGSGITSAKDVTSNKTQSTERLRQPIPSQGRKELLSLVQEALQDENRESMTPPLSKRKRVAASPGDAENFFLYPTPMPLQANGMSICGAGLLKSKGDGKPKKEGPCVGTKGFKAPEVLFRSLHQGPKADVWSAGVTLLYLIIGRSPFAGDSDQNLKEIAKLRGSEDLWEVAKLHNHESLFPKDLLDVKYLTPMKLREWCEQNTRRQDFLEAIPRSLFDLVDRCLTVNPRHRISAEEALCHEFFKPSRDAIRKAKSAKARDLN